MTGRASVVGAGVGTLTCGALLARRGWDVDVDDGSRRPPPALVLNEVALTLLGDVWGDEVLDGSHPIGERRVRWGRAASEAVVPVRSTALDGGTLVARLRDRLAAQCGRPVDHEGHGPHWTVHGTSGTGGDGLPSRAQVSFGRRCVVQAGVEPVAGLPPATWLETVDDGWVHLAPVAADRAVVQCMVPVAPQDALATAGRMVAATTAIRDLIGAWDGSVSVFPVAPRMSLPACGRGWIAVADAAVSLDPISGSGTAWAVRGGILAAAVVDGIASGLPAGNCLRHYDARLGEALHAHVRQCIRLYGSVFSSPGWSEEIRLMARALEKRRSEQPAPSFAYRLNGLRLEPLPNRLAPSAAPG